MMLGGRFTKVLRKRLTQHTSPPGLKLFSYLRRLSLLTSAIVVGTSSLGLLPFSQMAYAAPAYQVYGTITDVNGQGLSGVTVDATATGGSTNLYGPVLTDSSGSYTLGVDAGTYDIHFIPPSGSGYNQTVESNYTVNNNQQLNIQFVPATHTFSGTLSDANGTPQSGVKVILSPTTWNGSNATGSAVTDSTGHFSINAGAGTYYLTVSSSSRNPGFEFSQSTPGIDLTNGDVTQDLKLNTATVHVSVKNADGTTASGVFVGGYATSGTTTMYAGDPGERLTGTEISEGTTDSNGNVDLVSLVGTTYKASPPAPDYNSICATISSVKTCLQSDVTVSGDTFATIQAAATHTFSGTLTNTSGAPQAGVKVILSPTTWNGSNATGSAVTDSAGHFTVNAGAGTYYLTISSSSRNVGYELSQSTPGIDLTNGDFTQNLQLKTAVIHVSIKNADGPPASGAFVGGYTNSATSALYPGDPGETSGGTEISEGTTDLNGNVDLVSLVGSTYKASPPAPDYSSICATISGTKTCLQSNVTVSGDTSVAIGGLVIHTFSGALTDTNGAPQSGVQVILSATKWNGSNQAGSAVTDSNGHFSVAVGAGTYYLTIHGGGRNPGFELSQSTPGIDLTNGDFTQNLRINTAVVHVSVKNADGTAASGVFVGGYVPSGLTSTLYPGDPGETSGGTEISEGTTDSNGNVNLVSFIGSTYKASPPAPDYSSICATISGIKTCLQSYVTVNGDTTVVFQQAPPLPNSPTLTAVSPTKQAVLNWGAVSYGTSYNIYRDGAKIGSTSSTATTFTDSTASDGNHSYYVTAVNSTGESGPSNTVVVLTDSTSPTISYSLAPATNSNGWNNSDVTVTFTCTDNSGGSGIANCTSPITVSTEGSNQTVTGIAADNAGNTASITVTINLDKTAPTITYSLSPAPNDSGWNNSDVTATFTCDDALSGVASCSSPVTINTEGGNQKVTGTTTDKAGNNASVTATVNLDKTPPLLGTPTWTANPVTMGNNTSFSVSATDATSGVQVGEYFIGSDPGVGNATALSWDGTNLSSGSFGANLAPGVYNVGIRAQDKAGNWSPVETVYLVVFDPAGPGYIVGQQHLTPTSNDTLPWISTSNNDFATFGFNVKYTSTGTVDSASSFSFNYDEKGNCGSPNTPACHTFDLASSSFDWLGIGGTNNSQGTFQGTAALTINGVAQTVIFRVEAVDGDQLTPKQSDSFLLKIYSQGSDPSTATPLYLISADFTPGTGNANGGVQVKK